MVVFGGQITKYYKFPGKMLRGSADGAMQTSRPLSKTMRTPADKSAWGNMQVKVLKVATNPGFQKIMI
jgi:hypothetical protein